MGLRFLKLLAQVFTSKFLVLGLAMLPFMDMSIKERELLLRSVLPPERSFQIHAELREQQKEHARTEYEANCLKREGLRMAACDKRVLGEDFRFFLISF